MRDASTTCMINFKYVGRMEAHALMSGLSAHLFLEEEASSWHWA